MGVIELERFAARKQARPEPTVDVHGTLQDAPDWIHESSLGEDERRYLHKVASHLLSKERFSADVDLTGHIITLGGGKRYHIEYPLTPGAQGAPFVARNDDGERVVLKISKPFNRLDMHIDRRDPSPYERVRMAAARRPILEASVLHELTKLGDANPLPKLLDAMLVPHPEDPNLRVSVLVMEYIQGPTLENVIEDRELSPADMVTVTEELGRALVLMHEKKISHGDIKPNNIILQINPNDHTSTVRLVDVGIARFQERLTHQTGPIPENFPNRPDAVRPNYAVPVTNPHTERYANSSEHATLARDAYSYGRTIQHMLYGEEFTDYEAMSDLYKELTPEQKVLSRLADKLVTNQTKRLSIPEALVWLEQQSAAIAAK